MHYSHPIQFIEWKYPRKTIYYRREDKDKFTWKERWLVIDTIEIISYNYWPPSGTYNVRSRIIYDDRQLSQHVEFDYILIK